MDFNDVVEVLTRHGFKRVYESYTFFRGHESPIIALAVCAAPSTYQVELTCVFGPTTDVPTFATSTLVTKWALDRQLTDILWPMRRVCSWCQKVMADGREPTTHGICPECFAEVTK